VLRLFSDRLELENPGGLYGRMTLDLLGRATADTRNPFIAGAMELLSLTENRYSGIPTIQRLMRENGLLPAEFEIIRGSFRVTLYNRRSGENADAGDIKRQIVEFCNIPRTREELANRFSDMTISYFMGRYLKPLIQKGIIHLSIPDKPRSKYQKYYA
jgi:ATP-dependent DNA helicase RecG